MHEFAFVDQSNVLNELKQKFETHFGQELFIVEFADSEVPLNDAVTSYLFNSQLVTRPDGKMTLICPLETKENRNSLAATQRLLSEANPVDSVEFLELRQSMNNGGGPACLRLRVAMTEAEQSGLHQGVLFGEELAERLKDWVAKHYRETLSPNDLRDPNLIEETAVATEALMNILNLPHNLTGLSESY